MQTLNPHLIPYEYGFASSFIMFSFFAYHLLYQTLKQILFCFARDLLSCWFSFSIQRRSYCWGVLSPKWPIKNIYKLTLNFQKLWFFLLLRRYVLNYICLVVKTYLCFWLHILHSLVSTILPVFIPVSAYFFSFVSFHELYHSFWLRSVLYLSLSI